jgi:hypothetical protein
MITSYRQNQFMWQDYDNDEWFHVFPRPNEEETCMHMYALAQKWKRTLPTYNTHIKDKSCSKSTFINKIQCMYCTATYNRCDYDMGQLFSRWKSYRHVKKGGYFYLQWVHHAVTFRRLLNKVMNFQGFPSVLCDMSCCSICCRSYASISKSRCRAGWYCSWAAIW